MTGEKKICISVMRGGFVAVVLLAFCGSGCSGRTVDMEDGRSAAEADGGALFDVVDDKGDGVGVDGGIASCVVGAKPCKFVAGTDCVFEGGCFVCACQPGGWASRFSGCLHREDGGGEVPCSTWYWETMEGSVCKTEPGLRECKGGEEARRLP